MTKKIPTTIQIFDKKLIFLLLDQWWGLTPLLFEWLSMFVTICFSGGNERCIFKNLWDSTIIKYHIALWAGHYKI
jgi:hypothetical protein